MALMKGAIMTESLENEYFKTQIQKQCKTFINEFIRK